MTAGESDLLTLIIDTTGLPEGLYRAEPQIYSNAGEPVVVPISVDGCQHITTHLCPIST